eukprot:Seg3784.4 transcript_id=Seg3784.4/GoldUCD/mRNA.D3Y31 product="hypothetical protein" protein_id=Seg3784.4/GoldUCD/D3Y31
MLSKVLVHAQIVSLPCGSGTVQSQRNFTKSSKPIFINIIRKLSAQDAQEIISGKERRLSRFDRFRKTKHTLQLRCAAYGLSTVGKKAALIDRVYAHLHPAAAGNGQGSSGVRATAESSGSENEDEDEEMQQNHTVSRPPRQQGAVSDDHLRNLIRQEMSLHQPIPQVSISQQPLVSAPKMNSLQHVTPQPLSPASMLPTTPNPSRLLTQNLICPVETQLGTSQYAPTAAHVTGNTPIQSIINTSLLPPLSEKVTKEIKNKEFINFNNLLPNMLYDASSELDNLYLKVNPNSNGEQSLSFSSKNDKKKKISDAASWLEAWNIYIRAMVHFHPELAPELLVYQESICTYQRMYPASAWLNTMRRLE